MLFFPFLFYILYNINFCLFSFNSFRLYNNLTNLTQYFNLINKCYNPKIIATLTSYKSRLLTINKIIDSILNQTLKPNKIILTLFYKDYNLIPKKIKDYLIKKKIELIIVNIDIKPHKKYFYSMQKYPYDIIIVFDDDIIYDKNTIKSLYYHYLKYPDCVSARRVHLIKYNKTNNKALTYNKWIKDYKLIKKPSFDLLATGVGGILYPPNILKIHYSLIYELFKCFTSDDLYLKYRENLFKIKIVWVPCKHLMGIKSLYIKGLYNTENKINNDKCLENFKIKKLN